MATTSSPPTLPAKRPARRRGRIALWLLVALLLVAALVPPWINIGRYRLRSLQAIGNALGYEVSASDIYMRVFPRPGVVLSNFVISDDPAYSAEPMLRADQVVAYFHVSSLWRGRLEIGRLAFENPSLNLVRRSDGHWNVEELIQRSSHSISFAPTAKKRPEARPRFPYIEATTGRINFKLGAVKKAFSFTDADFALWRESENEWGLRLRAKPMRTDLALSDTGLLELDGRFQRAGQLRDTPVQLKLDFTKGQLGQITKLIYGRDRGWRGSTNASATMSGTPAQLSVVLDTEVNDFRRYDIALGDSLRLRAHCTGTFSSSDDYLSDVVCESPVTPGVLRVTGEARNWGLESYRIAITAQQVPMDRLVALARHAKKDLPTDLNASGEADAAFQVTKLAGEAPQWAGGGRSSKLALQSSVLDTPLEIGELQFVLTSVEPRNRPSAKRAASAHTQRNPRTPPAAAAGFTLSVKPFTVAVGASSPAVVSAYFDEQNYETKTSGPVELKRLMQVARAIGVGTPGIGLSGKAQVEVELSGSWMGFSPPNATGSIQLQEVTAELQGVNEPLRIEWAKAQLGNQTVTVGSFTASFTTGPAVAGSVSFPVHCTTPDTCLIHFDLHLNQLSMARLNQLLNPTAQAQPWYRLLAIWQQRADALLKLHAAGSFDIAHLEMGRLPAENVHGQVQMNAGKVQVDVLRSELLGGHHNGRWTADFTQSPPRYVGGGTLQSVTMEQLSSLMHDNWATGQASGTFAVAMQGANPRNLRDSVTGSLDFSWSNGSLRHVTLEGRSTPLAFYNLTGVAEIGQGKLTFSDCELKSSGMRYQLSGTAGFDRVLNLRLQPASGTSYAIAGSLDKPQVATVPTTASQAKLQ